jgi:hypothetical protein
MLPLGEVAIAWGCKESRIHVEEMKVEEKNFGRRGRKYCLEVKISQEIQMCQDNGRLIFYTHKTFLKYHPNFKVRKLVCRSSHKVPLVLVTY